MPVANSRAQHAILQLWQLVRLLTIATTVFFAVLTGITATPADLNFFVVALSALAAPPALTIACLNADRRRMAAYCSIPGVLISAGACCFMLFAFVAPPVSLAQILLYPVGAAFALPYGYASVLQLSVASTICVRQSKRRVALDSGDQGLFLIP